MLPKKYRLPASQFAAVKSHGQLLRTPLFGLLINPSSAATSRFGFIISTKISNKATVRNRIRRLLREAIRLLLPSMKPGHDFIILAKHPLTTARLDQISHTFHEIFTPYFN